MTDKKYALLDTDFISKMYRICKDEENRLIDRIMKMPGYEFYCHKQVEVELQRYNIAGALEWFHEKTADHSVILYDDVKIMDELEIIYGELSADAYAGMLKAGCDAYKAGYFEEKFVRLSRLDYSSTDRDAFLETLNEDCNEIGRGQNLGELKSYVFLQTLNMKLGEKIYVFCSDDNDARKAIISLGNAKCISVLSSFIRLQDEINLTREEAEPYIKSYMDTCLGKGQTTFRIQDTSKEKRICRVPCEQVFEEMFLGKIEELKTGNLRYKSRNGIKDHAE